MVVLVVLVVLVLTISWVLGGSWSRNSDSTQNFIARTAPEPPEILKKLRKTKKIIPGRSRKVGPKKGLYRVVVVLVVPRVGSGTGGFTLRELI